MNIEDPMQQNIRRTGMATMPPLMMKLAMLARLTGVI